MEIEIERKYRSIGKEKAESDKGLKNSREKQERE